MISSLVASSVRIKYNNEAVGTGILISECHILTCAHVLLKSFDPREVLPNDFISIHLNSNDGIARRVSQVWMPDGVWDYRKDIAVVEIESPFGAGEQIIRWNKYYPNPLENVYFFGHRTSPDIRAGEVVKTSICQFNDERGCFMLQDQCAAGFSGGPLVKEGKGNQLIAIGIIIAYSTEGLERTWALPASTIENVLKPSTYRLPYIVDYPACRIDPISEYLNYLEKIKQKQKIDKYFMDIQCEFVGGSAAPIEHSAIVFLKEQILSSKNYNNRVCIIGNYGTGKTCLAVEACSQLVRDIVRSGGSGVLPIYVKLSHWDQIPTESSFVSHLVDTQAYPIENRADLINKISNNLIYFVFDELDEMQKEIDPDILPGIIQKIPNMLPIDASFVILGRSSFFISYSTIEDLFILSRDDIPPGLLKNLTDEGYTTVKLMPLNKDHIRAYLEHYHKEHVEEILRIISDHYNLSDLATRPVLLKMIVECYRALAAKGDRIKINPASLYHFYVNSWLKKEQAKSALPSQKKFELLEELALQLVESERKGISYGELTNLVVNRLGRSRVQSFYYDIANCTFLDLIGDEYQFSHRSFHEYFVASAIVRRYLLSADISTSPFERYFKKSSIINVVVDFMRDILVSICEKDPAIISKLFRWLKSEFNSDRSYVGHLIGHVAGKTNDTEARKRLYDFYKAESDPWPKRSLALACGRAGNQEIINEYVTRYLPISPHREVNLSYHLEYYGTLERTICAIISHVCSEEYEFLRKVDVFTLSQILSIEKPLTILQSETIIKIKNIIGGYTNLGELEENVKIIGISGFIDSLSANGG